MGILGILAMPFGFDAECWRQMGYGIEWMDAVALWVAGLPGAFGRVTAFDAGPLLLATAGLLLIGLLKTPLRWSGAALALLAVVWAGRAPVPDILVAEDGRTFAVRGAAGKLAVHNTGGDTFATREWLAADADGRDVHDRSLGEGIACDPWGCIGRKIAGVPLSLWHCASRHKTAPRWSSDARCCAIAGLWRFALSAQALSSMRSAHRPSTGLGRLGSTRVALPLTLSPPQRKDRLAHPRALRRTRHHALKI
jgi:hypothetical protein